MDNNIPMHTMMANGEERYKKKPVSSLQDEWHERSSAPVTILSRMSSMVEGVRKRLSSVTVTTYILFCLFGVGSWVAINGVWAELPILLVTQPECYKLATALTLIFQVANVGPLTYSIAKIVWHKLKLKGVYLEVTGVFVIVVIGIVSSVLLGVFWNHTVPIGGQSNSLVLYILAFSLALVDCTSSVVFVPFMKHFPSPYLSALYIGEGLSGLVPSTVALIQGSVNNSLVCMPGEGTHYSISELELRFSPSLFFLILAVVMVVCGLAFVGILLFPSSRNELLRSIRNEEKEVNDEKDPSPGPNFKMPCVNKETTEVDDHISVDEGNDTAKDDASDNSAAEDESSDEVEICKKTVVSRTNLKTLLKIGLYILWKQRTPLFCLTVLSFVLNGALPSFSSFAFGSYGNLVLHLAINLGLLMNPIAAFTFMVIPSRSHMLIAVFTAICCLLATYVLINSLSYGVLVSGTVGGVLMIVFNAIMTALGSYTKVAIAVTLHSDKVAPDIALILNGICTQLGALLGAILFFCLVYFTQIFPSY